MDGPLGRKSEEPALFQEPAPFNVSSNTLYFRPFWAFSPKDADNCDIAKADMVVVCPYVQTIPPRPPNRRIDGLTSHYPAAT